jgi:hypothetical protein
MKPVQPTDSNNSIGGNMNKVFGLVWSCFVEITLFYVCSFHGGPDAFRFIPETLTTVPSLAWNMRNSLEWVIMGHAVV